MNRLMPASVFFIVITCAAAVPGERSFERTLLVSSPADLDVTSDIGGITLTAGPSNSVRIRAILRPALHFADLGRSDANIRELERNPPIEQIGNRVRIGYVKDRSVLNGVSMRLVIEAPLKSQLYARTTSGGIRVDGVRGPVNSQTHSGRIEIFDAAGEVRAVTHSGGVVVNRADGSVFARNDSGGIRIAQIGGTVDSRTASGRIELDDVVGEVRATTDSGSIIIRAAGGPVFAHNKSGSIDAGEVAGSIDARTDSGAIQLSQTKPAAIRARSDSGAIRVGLANGGGYAILAQSASGRISVPGVNDRMDPKSRRFQGNIGPGGPLVDIGTDSSKILIN